MTNQNRLYPVYDEHYKEFFIAPEAAPPVAVDYYQNDTYGRKHHLTQFLKVPLEVPNYLALCQAPGQRSWDVRDEIDGASLEVVSLEVVVEVQEEERVLFIPTRFFPRRNFAPGQEGYCSNLNFELRNFSGFSFETFDGSPIGKELFADFKKAGYEPLFDLRLVGTFNRQLNSLYLRELRGSKVFGVRNLETDVIIYTAHIPPVIEGLLQTIGRVSIGGAKLRQSLK